MRCDFVSRATSIRFCCWSNVQHVLYLLDIIYFSLWANDPIHNSSSPLPFIEIHLLHHLQMYMMHIISTRRNLLYLGYGVVFSFSLQPPCCVLSAPCKIKITFYLLGLLEFLLSFYSTSRMFYLENLGRVRIWLLHWSGKVNGQVKAEYRMHRRWSWEECWPSNLWKEEMP